jgi:hypothetical protein
VVLDFHNLKTRNTTLILLKEMSHHIEPHNRVVVQKTLGGLPPRLQLQLGPRRVAQLMQREEDASNLVGNRVAAERAEAATRGVPVVYEDTKVERFVEIVISDND